MTRGIKKSNRETEKETEREHVRERETERERDQHMYIAEKAGKVRERST